MITYFSHWYARS